MDTVKVLFGYALAGVETLLHRLASDAAPFGITVCGIPLCILTGALAALLAGAHSKLGKTAAAGSEKNQRQAEAPAPQPSQVLV
jgi:hypothetical protein